MSLSMGRLASYFKSVEKHANDILAENTLNPYERGLLAGLQSRGSKAVKSKVISDAVSDVMNSVVNLDDSEVSVAEALTIKVVGEALANPSTAKLKDLAAIIGDVGAQKVEIVHSQVDEDLARAALGEGLDGEE